MSQNVEGQESTQNTELDCEVAIGYVVFDAICFFTGALGLRATVQRPVIEAVGQAARPALSKIEEIIAQLASKEATTLQQVSGVWEIVRAIYSGQALGAVIAAFRNTLTWWNAILFGVGALATIIAALATDGAAFAAEVAIVIVSAGFFFSDLENAVRVCKLTVSPPKYPSLPSGGRRKPHGGRVSILTRNLQFHHGPEWWWSRDRHGISNQPQRNRSVGEVYISSDRPGYRDFCIADRQRIFRDCGRGRGAGRRW